MRKLIFPFLLAGIIAGCSPKGPAEEKTDTPDRIVCAYMAHSATDSVSTDYINRLIYSHMYLDSTLTNVVVLNPDRLGYAASLRRKRPDLEVMVSFGGNPSTLSLAMRNDSLRAAVVEKCVDIISSYGLDGIDVDWEFPGRGENSLSEKEDVANFVKLLTDFRNALGPDKVITIACAGSGYGVDMKAMAEVLSQFNVMCYDMGTPPSHHSALYHSERVGWIDADGSVQRFLEGGVPPSKIVLGMPFYGRGTGPFDDFTEWRDIEIPAGATVEFDSVAMVPWIADSTGMMILTYDTPESLAIKCAYIKEKDLAGAMYWRIEEDDSLQTLSRAVYESF